MAVRGGVFGANAVMILCDVHLLSLTARWAPARRVFGGTLATCSGRRPRPRRLAERSRFADLNQG